MLTTENYNNLSEKEKYYFQQIEYYSNEIPYMSINSLAAKIFTSPATLSRLVKKLGYSSFKEFKSSFILESQNHPTDSLQQHINYLFDTIPEVVEYTVIEHIKKSNAIFIVCFGNSVGLGQELAIELTKLKYVVFKIFDSEFLQQISSIISDNDLVIYISYNGADIDMQKQAVALKHKNTQILLTSSLNCPLSSHVSLVLNTHTEKLKLPFITRFPLSLVISVIINQLHGFFE